MSIVMKSTDEYMPYVIEIFKIFNKHKLDFNSVIHTLVLAIVTSIDGCVATEHQLDEAKGVAESIIRNFEKERHN